MTVSGDEIANEVGITKPVQTRNNEFMRQAKYYSRFRVQHYRTNTANQPQPEEINPNTEDQKIISQRQSKNLRQKDNQPDKENKIFRTIPLEN